MQRSSRASLLVPAVAATALLLMGANSSRDLGTSNSAISTSTSSITSAGSGSSLGGSVKSTMTGSTISSLSSTVTSSPTASTMIPAKPGKPTTTRVTLSPHAEELARTIKFDRQVLLIVKELTQEPIRRLVGYDKDDYQIIAPGIVAPVPEEKIDRILDTLRKKLAPLHYMPFVVEINSGLKLKKIGVIKGTDQYEILRIMHTDGNEYDISNQDVIDRLKEWREIASFDIIGADSDCVEIRFKKLPKDIKSFAKEVSEFSPDTLMQGPGTVEKLAKEIQRTKKVMLLWE